MLFMAVAGMARAVRPFITDDARVVGLRYAQAEAWQQWDMLAYGPTKWLELSVGGGVGLSYTCAQRT